MHCQVIFFADHCHLANIALLRYTNFEQNIPAKGTKTRFQRFFAPETILIPIP